MKIWKAIIRCSINIRPSDHIQISEPPSSSLQNQKSELIKIRLIVQQWLAWLFNSCWHDSSTVAGTSDNSNCHDSSTVAGTILQQSLERLFSSHWHNYSKVAGTILQQSLAEFFNSDCHDCPVVTDTTVQQSLAWLFNSHWHDYSVVTGMIVQQSLARFFNSHGQDSFFYASRILQLWCSLLKNRTMYQEYNTWSCPVNCRWWREWRIWIILK